MKDWPTTQEMIRDLYMVYGLVNTARMCLGALQPLQPPETERVGQWMDRMAKYEEVISIITGRLSEQGVAYLGYQAWEQQQAGAKEGRS